MRMTVPWVLAAALGAMALWACGATIGDPCTTGSDCGPGTCLNEPSTPGGYCSLACGPDAGACPHGSACVGERCYLRCPAGSGCRSGYRCQAPDGGGAGADPVCLGPGG